MARTDSVAKPKIRKGDRVQVISGKDLGREGTVTSVIPDKGKVIVEGINVAKRHQKQTRSTMQGGIIDKDLPIDISNLMIVCPSCGPTRAGYKFNGENTDRKSKVRVCRKCGNELA